MQTYIAKRLLLVLPTLFLVTTVTFLLVRAMPGDVLMARLAESGLLGSSAGGFNDAEREALRERLGLNDPLPIQYVKWVGGIATGDFGESLWNNQPVAEVIGNALPATLQLGVMALALAWLLALPLGIISAVRRNTVRDYAARFITIGGIVLPDFWVGVIVILLLSKVWNYFPPLLFVGLFDDPRANLEKLILPALILGFRLSAIGARMTRSAMLEVLGSDYIRTAWAKGLNERAVVMRHALRNSVLPVITVLGAQLSILIGGTVIMETLFVIPGMGRLAITSVTARDFPLIQANVLVLSVFVVFANLLVDISYGFVDPRIRYS